MSTELEQIEIAGLLHDLELSAQNPDVVPHDALSERMRLACKFITDLHAKLSEVERLYSVANVELANVRNQLATVEAQAAGMRQLLQVDGCIDPNCGGKGWYSVAKEGPHGDPIEEQVQCQWCFEKSLALSADCGTSLIARLEEARWLLETSCKIDRLVNYAGNDVDLGKWVSRRDSWLSGHTASERLGKEAK